MQKVCNEEVKRRLDVKENLMQMIMKRKLVLFGHVCRMEDSRKIKSVMFGMINGNTRRGRPSRERPDDIRLVWKGIAQLKLRITRPSCMETHDW
jgi:hypothetical protein